jgi:hypothetical protein
MGHDGLFYNLKNAGPQAQNPLVHFDAPWEPHFPCIKGFYKKHSVKMKSLS